MHSLSSVYWVTIYLRISGLPVAYYQEVAICMCDNWYVLYALVECRRDRQSQLNLYRETCEDICIVLILSEAAKWREWKYMEKRSATFTATLRLLDLSSSAVSARVYDIAHSKMWQRLVTSRPMNMTQTVWVFSWNQCQDCKSVLYKIYCILLVNRVERRWDLRSSGKLRSIQWYFFTDVSGTTCRFNLQGFFFLDSWPLHYNKHYTMRNFP
jgi:hypothetical protein